MRKIRINMLSNADKVHGQGVGSAYLEQVALVKNELNEYFDVVINDSKPADIIHCHTILPQYLMKMKRNKGVNVAYVHFLPDTLDGSILVYGDMKIGCVLRLERDTIVGKAEESSEKHFDAWSDFYRELHSKNLNFIQMNVMEPSGKDPRLNTLGVTASNASNANIRMALELEMGHLKRISNAMLSEFEYILVYSKQLSRMDTLTDDIIECTYSLLDGAYASVKILNEKEIYELPKSLFNTLFFNGIQAQINVYKSENVTIPEIMKIYRLTDDSNNKYDIGDKENTVLDKLSTLVNNDELHFGEWSVKDALEGNIEKVNKFNDKKLGSDEADDEEDKALEKKKKKVKKEKKKPLRKDKKHNKNAKNNQIEEAVNESDELDDDDLFG